MRVDLRSVCALVLGCASAIVSAAESTYPQRPVRLIIPFTAGGSTDLAQRIVAQKLTERFGQQVVPDNRPGAGTMLATELASRAPPDGCRSVDSWTAPNPCRSSA